MALLRPVSPILDLFRIILKHLIDCQCVASTFQQSTFFQSVFMWNRWTQISPINSPEVTKMFFFLVILLLCIHQSHQFWCEKHFTNFMMVSFPFATYLFVLSLFKQIFSQNCAKATWQHRRINVYVLCLYVFADINENYAYFHVSFIDGSRNAYLYINLYDTFIPAWRPLVTHY